MTRYRALVEIRYLTRDGRWVDAVPGTDTEIIDQLPPKTEKDNWLLAQGLVEPIDENGDVQEVIVVEPQVIEVSTMGETSQPQTNDAEAVFETLGEESKEAVLAGEETVFQALDETPKIETQVSRDDDNGLVTAPAPVVSSATENNVEAALPNLTDKVEEA